MIVVWLIEDNPAFRKVTQRMLNLETTSYTSRAFGSCEEALAELAHAEKPRLILLDVGLPGMDGIEGIQHFIRLIPDVVILVLTVFSDDDKIFRAICAGASGYLLKSEPIENVVVAMEQALAGGSPMNPTVARRVLSMFSKLAPLKKDYGLTPREQAVLELMVAGQMRKQVAETLKLSAYTVDFYVRTIYKKLHVNCLTAAVSVAMKNGLVPPRID